MQATVAPVILVVDDNPGDIELTKIGFSENGVAARFPVAVNGAQAISLLRDMAAGQVARPHLVLLDLNMPQVHGTDVLAFIKQDPVLSTIPTVVLTTSDAPRDRARCAELGADDYLVKPSRFDHFLGMLKSLERYLPAA